MLRILCLRSFLLLVLFSGLIVGLGYQAKAQSCSYFSETFTGTPTHSWESAYGQWTYGSGRLNVTGISEGHLAFAETSFFPSDLLK